jgi:AcrR family transcriptional regulator
MFRHKRPPMGEAGTERRSRGGKRERNKAGNRAAILAAARQVFSDLGYETATVRDVIGATTLAAGTFYNYFRDKESVLRALLDEKMAELQVRATEARRGAQTVEDIVRRTMEVSFAVVAEDRDVFDLLRRNAGAIRAILDEPSFVANRDDLRRDLERAMRRAGTPPVDAGLLAAAIGGLSFELAAAAVDRNPPALEAAAAFATAMVLGGISALPSTGRVPSTPKRSAAARGKARGTRE